MGFSQQAAERAYQATRKNLVHNGNFSIWQRGTSFTTNNSYIVDRWFYSTSNTSSFTASRQSFTLGQTDVPGEPKYYLRFDGTHVGTGGWHLYRNHIEDVRTAAGQTVTLSAWIKADAARNCALALTQVFGSGGSPSSSVVYWNSVPVTTSWARYSVTIDVGSVSGKTIGTNGNDYLAVDIGLPQNTASVIDVANVQLEYGNHATDFEQRDIGTELALCQRYFCKSYRLDVVPGTADLNGCVSSNTTSGGFDNMSISFPTTMRTAPSVTIYAPDSGTSNRAWVSGTGDVTLANVDRLGDSVIGRIRVSGVTANNSWRVHYTADAEF